MVEVDPIRGETLQEIIEYVLAGTSVNIVGMQLAGRSAVLRDVSARLETRGMAVARIAGVRGLRDRALGALQVASVDAPATAHPSQLLAAAICSLEEMLSGGPGVLAIDDADELDSTTAGVIAGVCVRRSIPVMMTSRLVGLGEKDMAALTQMVHPAARVAVPPMPFNEVHRFVHELLGGPVDPAALARIATMSGGLPGLVRAIVGMARRDRKLAVRGGLWVARGELWTPSLAQTAELFLTDLDEDSVEAVTTLAYAGTTDLRTARHALPLAALTRLDEAGLLHTRRSGTETVLSVFPPVLEEYVRHEGSVARRLRAQEVLAAAEHVPAQGSEAGRELDPGMLLDPADDGTEPPLATTSRWNPVMSQHMHRHWLSKIARLRTAWRNGPTPATATPLIEALLTIRARPYQIDEVIAGTVEGDADDRTLASYASWCRLHHQLACGRREDEPANGDVHGDSLASATSYAEATEMYVRLVTDRVPDGHGVVIDEPIAADHDHGLCDPQALIVVRAEALVAGGRAKEALALLDNVDTGSETLRRHSAITRELALVLCCDFDEAIESAQAHIACAWSDCDPAAVEGHAYVLGLALACQGRLVELEELASAVLTLACTPAHGTHFKVGLLTLAAIAARLQGRVAYAQSLAFQSVALGRYGGPHPWMDPDMVSAVIGEEEEDADHLWQLAEDRFTRGYRAAGMIAGVAAIERRPDPGRAAQLSAVAKRCDAPLLTHLAAYAVAIASADPDRLADIAPVLSDVKLRQYAVHATVARVLALREAEQYAKATELAHAAWTQAGMRGRDLCGLFRPLDRAVRLSAREREVAILVARGFSSPDIAQSMVLSTRTVENHIFNACHKIGVDTREGLARAAQTWLSCMAK